MLRKATAMGAAATYREIAQASTPEAAKSLGRQVKDFSDQVWARVECSVAFQVVAQKFMTSPELQELLLREDGLFAEMTRKDANWGTGIDRSEPREVKCNPSNWAGTDMFGWALTVCDASAEVQ